MSLIRLHAAGISRGRRRVKEVPERKLTLNRAGREIVTRLDAGRLVVEVAANLHEGAVSMRCARRSEEDDKHRHANEEHPHQHLPCDDASPAPRYEFDRS